MLGVCTFSDMRESIERVVFPYGGRSGPCGTKSFPRQALVVRLWTGWAEFGRLGGSSFMLEPFTRGTCHRFDQSGPSRNGKHWRGGTHSDEGFVRNGYYKGRLRRTSWLSFIRSRTITTPTSQRYAMNWSDWTRQVIVHCTQVSGIVSIVLITLFSGRGFASELEDGFRQPPPDARPFTWWHWLDGNITREGITKDLEGMARIGLGGAYMFNAGRGAAVWPEGSVRFLQPDWLDMVSHTLHEADRLGLVFGVHNCDGFSMAGGPWITPDMSMKILTWTSQDVKGPGPCDVVLPTPPTRENFYRDITTIAFPLPKGGRLEGTLAGSLPRDQLAALSDRNPNSYANFPPTGKGHVVTWRFPVPVVVRSLEAENADPEVWEGDVSMWLEVSDDGSQFRPVGAFTLNWNFKEETRQVTAAVTASTGRVFRLVFTNGWFLRIGELWLSDAAKVHFAEAKAARLRVRGHGAESRHYDAYPGPSSDEVLPPDTRVPGDLVVDLRGHVDASGRLRWHVPPGRWRILRIGYTSNGRHNHPATREGTGLECDKFDARAVRLHLEQYVGRLARLAGPERVGRVFAAMELDSWECGIQNWTDGFERRFEQRLGYALHRFWPALLEGWIVDDRDTSERMLWDWRRFLADQLAENFFGTAAKFAREVGLTYVGESTGRQQYLYDVAWQRIAAVPMGEFWLGRGPGVEVRVDCKVASSIAHIHGQPIVAAESYTASPRDDRWDQHPFTLKPLGDRAFCAGINQFVFHTFAHQPWDVVGPGFTFYRWGLNFNRHNTWWEPGRAWIEYISRCQFLLRQGRSVADVLAFVGEDIPNRIGWRTELRPPLPTGYDFDGADAEAIRSAQVVDGQIVLPSGTRYRVLLLPDRSWMRADMARKVRRLIEDGATVLAPRVPTRSPSLAERGKGDEAVRAAFREAAGVGEYRIGRGRLFVGSRFEDMWKALGVPPDVEAPFDALYLGWIHRRIETPPTDIYFVANHAPTSVLAQVVFRDASGAPELWDPVAGRVQRTGVFRRGADGRCELPLYFPAHGSVFVVFRGGPVPDHVVACRARLTSGGEALEPPPVERTSGGQLRMLLDHGHVAEVSYCVGRTTRIPAPSLPAPRVLAGPWRVRFPPGRGAPEEVVFERCQDWTQHENPGIRHFSGTATYSIEFDLPDVENRASLEWWLDLGDVRELAEVLVNDQSAGILWCPPFRCRVDPYLHGGRNRLTIRVTNLWVNRLIGDAALPDDVPWSGSSMERFPARWPDWLLSQAPRPSGRIAFATRGGVYSTADPLVPSGLLGPVVLRPRMWVELP